MPKKSPDAPTGSVYMFTLYEGSADRDIAPTRAILSSGEGRWLNAFIALHEPTDGKKMHYHVAVKLSTSLDRIKAAAELCPSMPHPDQNLVRFDSIKNAVGYMLHFDEYYSGDEKHPVDPETIELYDSKILKQRLQDYYNEMD